MSTNMTGLRCFFKNDCVFVLWTRASSALVGLRSLYRYRHRLTNYVVNNPVLGQAMRGRLKHSANVLMVSASYQTLNS